MVEKKMALGVVKVEKEVSAENMTKKFEELQKLYFQLRGAFREFYLRAHLHKDDACKNIQALLEKITPKVIEIASNNMEAEFTQLLKDELIRDRVTSEKSSPPMKLMPRELYIALLRAVTISLGIYATEKTPKLKTVIGVLAKQKQEENKQQAQEISKDMVARFKNKEKEENNFLNALKPIIPEKDDQEEVYSDKEDCLLNVLQSIDELHENKKSFKEKEKYYRFIYILLKDSSLCQAILRSDNLDLKMAYSKLQDSLKFNSISLKKEERKTLKGVFKDLKKFGEKYINKYQQEDFLKAVLSDECKPIIDKYMKDKAKGSTTDFFAFLTQNKERLIFNSSFNGELANFVLTFMKNSSEMDLKTEGFREIFKRFFDKWHIEFHPKIYPALENCIAGFQKHDMQYYNAKIKLQNWLADENNHKLIQEHAILCEKYKFSNNFGGFIAMFTGQLPQDFELELTKKIEECSDKEKPKKREKIEEIKKEVTAKLQESQNNLDESIKEAIPFFLSIYQLVKSDKVKNETGKEKNIFEKTEAGKSSETTIASDMSETKKTLADTSASDVQMKKSSVTSMPVPGRMIIGKTNQNKALAIEKANSTTPFMSIKEEKLTPEAPTNDAPAGKSNVIKVLDRVILDKLAQNKASASNTPS